MVDVKDILVYVGTIVVFVLQQVLGNTLYIIIKAHQNYPDLTSVIFILVGIYLIHKIFIKSIKTWFKLMVTAVKIMLVLSFFLVAFIIYARGWERFTKQDLPFLNSIVKGLVNLSSNATASQGGFSPWSLLKLLNPNANVNANAFSQQGGTSGEPLDDGEAYLNYMKQKFGDGSQADASKDYSQIHKLVEEGVNYVQNNVNFDDLGYNLIDWLSRYQP
ncbi:uncharacterized protein LODBEIA_P19400 [Lodderomyces beijingensis]|uniref:Uncharacterized protein n=1 Tax=Lodderomyces beijingensis TaxID=1775926 RepID=A0ABP0ZKS2_9ASCO